MASSGDTTVRAQDSHELPARFDSLVVSWLFPPECVASVRLSEVRNVVGRDADCAIRLDIGSVSRKHAEIYRDGPVFALRDLGSTNGTFLNGRRIAHGALAPGDVLRIGESVALVAGAQVHESRPGVSELAPDLVAGPALELLLEPVRRASPSSLPIVLVGETGTGKEQIARAIHHWSGRRGPFQAINCAELPPNLVETELFGYRKGAFPGAVEASLGRLRAADGGTLLIDYVAEFPLASQAKLLRTFEQAVVTPLGESSGVPIDVRLVTATQRPLDALVHDGLLRADLRARLSGLVVSLPPLRARRDEIPALFEHFAALHSGGRAPVVEGKLVEALLLHEWPDNVRELELLVKKLLTLHGAEPLLKRSFLAGSLDLPTSAAQGEPDRGGPSFERRTDHDRYHFVEALKKTKGNVSAAAASLGFSRQRAYRLMNGKTAEELMAGCENEPPARADKHARSE